MTTGQLQAYARRLNEFRSRSVTYVAGLNGTPLSGSTWRAYKRAESIYNDKSTQFYDSVKDLKIPTLNQTVSQYMADLRQSRRQGDYKTFGTLERDAANITSEKSLQKLYRSMLKRADGAYLEKEADLQRRIINKMLRRTSNADLIPAIREMSDEEVITLQYTDFIPNLEGSYAMAKSISTDTPRWQSSVYEDSEADVEALVEWAHNHFNTRDTEQDSDDTRPASPPRDEYGRFVKQGTSNPEPHFNRDERGRFAKRNP